MKPQQILAEPARVLAQAAREAYFQQGYAIAADFLKGDWLETMRAAYLEAVERSREIDESNQWFSLQSDHRRDKPRIQRIERLPDQDDRFWEFVVDSRLADLAADIVGPDVVYRDSMINVKCPGSGGAVAWHQDLPFYPHTNTATIQILIALYDVPAEQGPLTVVAGSHRGRIYEHYDSEGNWSGMIRKSEHDSIDWGSAVELPSGAGDAILLHPLTVHGSGPNRSDRNRPFLIHGMSAADAISYTPMTWGNSHSGKLIRGTSARFAHHEAMTIPLPPDWSRGYTSIFEHHARSKRRGH